MKTFVYQITYKKYSSTAGPVRKTGFRIELQISIICMQKFGKNEFLSETCRQDPKKNSYSEFSQPLFTKTNQRIGFVLH